MSKSSKNKLIKLPPGDFPEVSTFLNAEYDRLSKFTLTVDKKVRELVDQVETFHIGGNKFIFKEYENEDMFAMKIFERILTENGIEYNKTFDPDDYAYHFSRLSRPTYTIEITNIIVKLIPANQS